MPGVYYTTTEFLDDAKSAARDRGMPGIRTLALPADKYYVGRASPQELQPIADAFFDKMVDALTRLQTDTALRQRLTNAAATQVRQKFSMPAMLARYEQMYRNVAGAPRP